MKTTPIQRIEIISHRIASNYISDLRNDLEPVKLKYWIKENIWEIFHEVDDISKSPEEVIQMIDDIARPTIKYELWLDPDLKEKLNELRTNNKSK